MKDIRIVLGKEEFCFSIPDSWDEVPVDIYPYMARLYLREPEHMNEYDKLVRAFSLFGLSAWKAVQALNDDQLQEMIQLVAHLFTDLNLSTQKLPYFDHNGCTYYGPLDELTNLRFGEFCMAESFLSLYNETKEAVWLDKLIAVLYRPIGKGRESIEGDVLFRGDIRERFNSNLIDYRAKVFADLDLAIKDGVMLFYATARNLLFIAYQNIFKKRSSAPKLAGVDWGWLGVYDDLLGEKGRTAETLEDEFVSTTLMSLDRAQLKHNESKKSRR